MTKKLITLLVVALTASCAQLEYEQDAAPVLQDETVETVYHPATNTVLAKVSDDSRLISTKAEDATHYAVKFFPKSTNELFTLIRTENVMTSYYPFGYTPTNLSRSESASDSEVFDENPYTETYTNPDNPEDVFVTTLPVIYAYWPITLVLPEGIDYEVCYSVQLTSKNTQESGMRGPGSIPQYPLYIRTYDNLLATYVPLRNIKVRIAYGGVWHDYYTDNNGYVLLDPSMCSVINTSQLLSVTVTLIYETGKWIISRNNSDYAINTVLGTILDLWGLPDPDGDAPSAIYYNLSSVTKECEIHRSVDFYHNSTHPYTTYIDSDEEGVIIHAMDNSSPDESGVTDYDLFNAPTIKIFNNNEDQKYWIGHTIHELGHVHHYYSMNSPFPLYTIYNVADLLILESYASFVGWIVGEYYYTSKGYVKTGLSDDVCGQNRQTWINTMTRGYYHSPFFIDLYDQYNQKQNGSLYADDVISDVPISFIESMAMNHITVQQCKNHLQQNVGSYYTSTELSTQMSYY